MKLLSRIPIPTDEILLHTTKIKELIRSCVESGVVHKDIVTIDYQMTKIREQEDMIKNCSVDNGDNWALENGVLAACVGEIQMIVYSLF